MFQGCSGQWCRLHYLRNLLSQVPKAGQDMVAAAMKRVFRVPGTGSRGSPLAAAHRDAARGVPHRRADHGCRARRRADVPELPAGELVRDMEH